MLQSTCCVSAQKLDLGLGIQGADVMRLEKKKEDNNQKEEAAAPATYLKSLPSINTIVALMSLRAHSSLRGGRSNLGYLEKGAS